MLRPAEGPEPTPACLLVDDDEAVLEALATVAAGRIYVDPRLRHGPARGR